MARSEGPPLLEEYKTPLQLSQNWVPKWRWLGYFVSSVLKLILYSHPTKKYRHGHHVLVVPGNSVGFIRLEHRSSDKNSLCLWTSWPCTWPVAAVAWHSATPSLYASLDTSSYIGMLIHAIYTKLNDSAYVILSCGFWRLHQVPDKVATCASINNCDVPPYFLIPKGLSKKKLSKLKPAKTVPMLDWLDIRAWQQYTVPLNLTVANFGTTHQHPGLRRTCTWQSCRSRQNYENVQQFARNQAWIARSVCTLHVKCHYVLKCKDCYYKKWQLIMLRLAKLFAEQKKMVCRTESLARDWWVSCPHWATRLPDQG